MPGKKLLALLAPAMALVLLTFAAPAPAQAAAEPGAPVTKTIRYGPYEIPATTEEGHGGTGNTFSFGVDAPCGDCFITGIKPDLVYENGSVANVNTGPMLHHFVLYNQFRSDPVCGTEFPNPSAFLGERFAASGNERTFIKAPEGYGYYNDPLSRWNMVADLMTHAEQPQTVYIEIEYTYVPGKAGKAQGIQKLRPVWLSAAGCYPLDEYAIEPGISTKTWDWKVNVPGRVIGMGGHQHNDGVAIRAVNVSAGEELCKSVAAYGETPEYINMHGHPEVSSMSRCISASGLGTLEKGDTVRLVSVYDSEKAQSDVMGIMMAFIAEN